MGEALAKAASLTFSQLFREISVVEDFPSVDSYPLVVEIKLERFDLRLQYAVFGYRRLDHLLDVEGKVRVALRLTQPGKSAWGKEY